VLPTTNAEKDLIQTPSLAEVETAVFALKTQRACGVDDIPAEFWRVPQACQALHTTICSVWLSEELPDDWLCGEMITILKGKGSKNDCKSYRPITLLCAAAKVMSAIIAKRISVVAMPMMRDSQSGFRAGHSCADQISIMRALMRRALATDRTLYVALLDFAQAFDTCDLRYIDESLKHHKVPLKLRRLVHALYNGAKSRVKGSKGSRSRWFPLRRGVRQGDTLSPLLFLILLNSVWEKVLGTERVCGVSVGQKTIPELSYADDIALLDECLDRMLQHTLHLLQEEAQNPGLQLRICPQNASSFE